VSLCALQIDAKNEVTWQSWIQMEEDSGRLEAANELRIRSSEQQWEFVIPASFSTRGTGPDGSSSSSGLLQSLLGTLNKFFSVRAAGSSNDSAAVAAAKAAAGSGGTGQQQLMAELLPEDYRTDLTLDDIINEAAALDVSNGSNGMTSGSNGSNGSSNGMAAAPEVLQQQGQQQQKQHHKSVAGPAEPAAHAADGSNSSSSRSKPQGRLFRRQQQQQQQLDRPAPGLQQRPVRPPAAVERSWEQ
jgi:hypothetical protein